MLPQPQRPWGGWDWGRATVKTQHMERLGLGTGRSQDITPRSACPHSSGHNAAASSQCYEGQVQVPAHPWGTF